MPAPQTPNSFKNQVTRRFYEYFMDRVTTGKHTLKGLAEAFGRESSNYSQFFHKMKSGSTSVTIDQIELAYQQFGLRPSYLFNETAVAADDEQSMGEEPLEQWGAFVQLGDQLHQLFKKHKTEVKGYAEKRLRITEQQLHKIFRGESRPYFDQVLQICEDLGESLDQFRNVPLPKGQLLERIRLLEETLAAKDKYINLLEKQTRS